MRADVAVAGSGAAQISALLMRLEEERGGQVVEPVFDFSEPGCDLSAWGALDDVVMGGVSQGQISLVNRNQLDQQAVFAGVVSTDNSGGFSSVRTQNFEPPFNFSGWMGLRLEVKGDGHRYKFILRNNAGWDSPAYIYGFDTVADEWISVDVPFAELVPTFRARSVPDASPYESAKTVSFQLMLSKFEYDKRLNPRFTAGPFKLAIKRIGLYRVQQDEAILQA
ncbi:CIA30 family protein [cf. Phormidesmis sp. LEGE 11477]|nr:CIA30 family protein [cf. Phormidesmis sp. LEGE 11477]